MPRLPSPAALSRALERYPDAVRGAGGESLPGLDRWYREELPRSIAGRTPRHLTLDELARLTEWKMARGVWRARNLALVRANDPAEVEARSVAAFEAIPHPTAPVSELARLGGVGPATASAALAAAAPDVYPFFDEEVAAALPGLGEVRWTLGYYRRYAEALREAAGEMGGEWTPARLERALWAVAREGAA